MNLNTRKISPAALHLNYKFTLRAVETPVDCENTNKLFGGDNIYIKTEKNKQINKWNNEKYQACTVDHEKKKCVTEDGNLDLVNKIIQQSSLELTFFR